MKICSRSLAKHYRRYFTEVVINANTFKKKFIITTPRYNPFLRNYKPRVFLQFFNIINSSFEEYTHLLPFFKFIFFGFSWFQHSMLPGLIRLVHLCNFDESVQYFKCNYDKLELKSTSCIDSSYNIFLLRIL